jgi:hypothetical protein
MALTEHEIKKVALFTKSIDCGIIQ